MNYIQNNPPDLKHFFILADLTSSQFQKEIMTLTGQLQDWTHVLDKSYSYHKSYLINREPKDKAMDQSSPCRDIFVAVHSLDLHLQAALTRYYSRTSAARTLIAHLPQLFRTRS